MPDMPKGVAPAYEDIIRGLPDGTSNAPLPDLSDVTYSEAWGVYVGGPPETHLVGIIMLFPEELSGQILMRTDGSIEYKKDPAAFEPPSPINGYKRDSENQWLFKPLWESCTWRHYKVAYKKRCQCIDILAKCAVNMHWVTFEDCQKCLARIPIKTVKKPVPKTRQSLRLPDLDRNSR